MGWICRRFIMCPARCTAAGLGFSPQGRGATYVGRLGEEKERGFLLDVSGAWRNLRQCPLLLVGERPATRPVDSPSQLTRGWQDRVVFTGVIPYAQVPRYMTSADVS